MITYIHEAVSYFVYVYFPPFQVRIIPNSTYILLSLDTTKFCSQPVNPECSILQVNIVSNIIIPSLSQSRLNAPLHQRFFTSWNPSFKVGVQTLTHIHTQRIKESLSLSQHYKSQLPCRNKDVLVHIATTPEEDTEAFSLQQKKNKKKSDVIQRIVYFLRINFNLSLHTSYNCLSHGCFVVNSN